MICSEKLSGDVTEKTLPEKSSGVKNLSNFFPGQCFRVRFFTDGIFSAKEEIFM